MSPLRRRMIDDMQIRNLTPNTRRVYGAQVVQYHQPLSQIASGTERREADGGADLRQG